MENFKKTLCLLLVFSFLFSILTAIAPASAALNDRKAEQVYSYLAPILDTPQAPENPASNTTVDIRNIPSGDNLLGNVLIVAQASGNFASVVCQVDQGDEAAMTDINSTNIPTNSTSHYEISLNTTTYVSGPHTLSVKAKDTINSDVAISSVPVQFVNTTLYTVRYEVDYIKGQAPDPAVLSYITDYWHSHAINVTFTVDDAVSDPTPADGVITNTDFWRLENQYNDGPTNSWAYGYQYFSQDKWMLYGTTTTNPNVGGYTYTPRSTRTGDYLGGNYIFIADKMIQNWEARYNVSSHGGEVTVTSHEAGHSIGIVVGNSSEKYDPDYYSVMSNMRAQNIKDVAPDWYYSKEYWTTANLNLLPTQPQVLSQNP